MGASAAALKLGAALTVAETTMTIVTTATTITAIELRNQLKRTIEGYQEEFKLMSKFEGILRTFNNNSSAINQVVMSSIQSINNWVSIANNMVDLNDKALLLTERYANIKIPENAWKSLGSIVGVTFGIIFTISQSVSLFFEFKKLPQEIAKVKQSIRSTQTQKRKNAYSIKNMRDKGGVNSDTQTSTDTSEVTIVQETGNTNKPGSKEIAKTKRNTSKLVKDFAQKWGKTIKNAFRSAMAAAMVYFFIMQVKGIIELKSQMRQWENMLGPGGSLEQDQKDLVILLDALGQDIYSLGTASYVSIMDFSNSFYALSMVDPTQSKIMLDLARKWDGETLVPYFNLKRVHQLYNFSKDITTLHVNFDKYKLTHTPEETRKEVIKTLQLMYNKFIAIEPEKVDEPSRISKVFNNIAIEINKGLPYASLLTEEVIKKLTYFSSFTGNHEKSFENRNNKITKIAGLWDRIKNKKLEAEDVTILYGYDKICLNGVVSGYISAMINNSTVPQDDHLDLGEDLQTLLSQLSTSQKNDIAIVIMQKLEHFFFDNATPPKDLTKAGTTIFGQEMKRMNETNLQFINRPSIPNMIYIPDNFITVESEAYLISKYKSINANLVKDEDIKKRERVIFMQLGNLKLLNKPEEEVSYYEYKRGLLITAQVGGQPKFFVLVSNTLSGDVWTFYEMTVDLNKLAKKQLKAHN